MNSFAFGVIIGAVAGAVIIMGLVLDKFEDKAKQRYEEDGK